MSWRWTLNCGIRSFLVGSLQGVWFGIGRMSLEKESDTFVMSFPARRQRVWQLKLRQRDRRITLQTAVLRNSSPTNDLSAGETVSKSEGNPSSTSSTVSRGFDVFLR